MGVKLDHSSQEGKRLRVSENSTEAQISTSDAESNSKTENIKQRGEK
jgi:hypothetical protein